MKTLSTLCLVVASIVTLPVRAEVTLHRTDNAIVIENAQVRVELRRDRNFQPSILVDKRNSKASLIDDLGFLAWEVSRSDWMTSATCDWTVKATTHSDDLEAYCETTLEAKNVKPTPSRFILRTTVRRGSPAVRFDFQASFQPEHVHTVGLRIQASGFKQAEWTTTWGTKKLELVGLKNQFHALLGFRNGMALTRPNGSESSGLLLFHNTAWNSTFPILREKPAFVRYKHSIVSSPGRCSITLVPFSNDLSLSVATKRWGRPSGTQLPVTRSRRRKTVATLQFDNGQRSLVAFPVAAFETVLPDLLPSVSSIGQAMRIQACPGEFEPASFAIRAANSLGEVTLNCSDLVFGKNRIPAAAIDAHVVKVWQQAGPPTMADATLGAGHQVPELLLKDDRVPLNGSRPDVRLHGPIATAVDAGSTKQFWLTVHVPDKLPAGHYRGNVAVMSNDKALLQVPLEVDVLPFSLLPSRKKHGIWFKPERRPDQREYVEPEVYRRLLQDVRDHGMQFVTIRGRGMRIAEDVLKIHQSSGMNGMTIWSSWFPSSVSDFGPLRKSLEAVTRKHGYKRLYFQAADEPNSDAQIARAMTYFAKVKAAGGLTFCNIMPEYAVRLGDRLDLPCVGYANFFGSLERPDPVTKQAAASLAQLLKSHEDVWYYWQCRVEDPRVNRLLFGFLLMKSPATGAMPYTYSTLETLKPFDDWSALRDGQISRAGGGAVYHTRNGSIPTIQWEAAREGVDDARYISTLENLIDKADKNPKWQAATAQARKKLGSVYARLPEHLHNTMNTVEPTHLDAMRAKVVEAILKLRRVQDER